jgi:hypothetical protein
VYLSALYGGAVRLSFHDAGEFDIRTTDSAGPDGCLSSASDNAGIVEPASVVVSILEPMWQKYCNQISRADFWALMGKLSVEAADPTRTISIPFYYGRTDSVGACEAGAGRLPGAEGGYASVQQVFVTQMGMTMSDAGVYCVQHSVLTTCAHSSKRYPLSLKAIMTQTSALIITSSFLYVFSHPFGRSHLGTRAPGCLGLWLY